MFERVKLSNNKEHIYLMNDADQAVGYIVIGKNKALVIDTMFGYENVYEIARTVTQLPLMLVNTHGHLDHIGGNPYFEEAYICPDDIPIVNEEVLLPEYQEGLKQLGGKLPTWMSILPGETIDLGEIELEVISLAGHTPGCIGFLDRKDRILFSGDGIIPGIWMQVPHSLPFKALLHTLDEVEDKYRKDFDYILTGHNDHLLDASLVEALRIGVQELINGKCEKDYDFTWGNFVDRAHPYDENDPARFIVYHA